MLYNLNAFFKKYLPLFIILGAALGTAFPESALALRRYILVYLAALVFFPALKIDRRSFSFRLSTQIWIVLIATLAVFGVIPLVMYTLGRLANLDGTLLVGLVLASAAPSMISSPYFTSLMNGNLVVAFSVTTVTTILSPFIIPYELQLLLATNMAIDVIAVAKTITFVLVIPIMLAVLTRQVLPNLVASFIAGESIFTVSALMLVNWVMIGTNRDSLVGSHINTLFLLLVLCLFQDFGFFFITRKVSRLFVSDRISKALAVSVGLKNVALVGGVLVIFNESLALASGVISLAHVLMFVVISLWKDKL